MAKQNTKIRKTWKLLRKRARQFVHFVKHRIFRITETMAVRHDYCRSRKPRLTVVFLHGIASSYDAWRDTVKILENDPELASVRFIGLDLMGFGHSPRPKKYNYDYADYRKALSSTLKKLKIRTPVILAGHSMGCLISMDYALSKPEATKQLIMVSPPVFRKAEIGGIADRFYHKAYSELKQRTGDPVVQQIANVVDFLSSFDKRTLDTAAFKGSMQNLILNEQNWRRVFSIKTPTQVVHGRFDPLIIGENLRILAARNRRVELTQTVGGHDITGLKQKKVVSIIKNSCIDHLSKSDK